MEYWRGIMNWPLAKDWKCVICNTQTSLTWGFINGVCRCDKCHAPYMMRDGDEILTTPKSMVREKSLPFVAQMYSELELPISKWENEVWETITKQVEG